MGTAAAAMVAARPDRGNAALLPLRLHLRWLRYSEAGAADRPYRDRCGPEDRGELRGRWVGLAEAAGVPGPRLDRPAGDRMALFRLPAVELVRPALPLGRGDPI